MKKIIIGSRESKLAVAQSMTVIDHIRKTVPDAEVRLLTMKTTGDKILDRTLDQVGGKGLFVKELDLALLEKRADLTVHSLKDLPMEISVEVPLVAFSVREDPRDVLVLPAGAEEPVKGLPIGTSSLRRALQLKKLYPGYETQPVRGNLQTRLKKLDEGQYGALVLAAAGLRRMGLEHRISRYFSTDEIIPAAGQGIIVVQGRAGEDYSYLEGYQDPASEAAAICERAYVRTLNGGCTSPVCAFAQVWGEQIHLKALYYEESTGCFRTGTIEGPVENARELGIDLAHRLKNAPEKGKVWLVGAGPGDPGLFTLHGKEVLQQADVVVYDALVSPGILRMIPDQAKTIFAGKRSGNHYMKQEETNRVLLEEAEQGNRVVRLKGGDPFLFGRGGEELELLSKNGIPFEVVPGITSAFAVPAYNGIPVTHRDHCSGVHVITGHKRQDSSEDIDFEALVRTKGTLVFLMGIEALPRISSGLLAAGMEPDTPAAILEKGTTAAQRKIISTLSELAEASKRQEIQTPAVIVVGSVCSLSTAFSWYEKLPLAGSRIVITRPKEVSGKLAEMLRREGAEVLEIPVIAVVPVKDTAPVVAEIQKLKDDGYNWLVFTSPGGVRIFFEMLLQYEDIRTLGRVRIAAIGPGTEKELRTYGLKADFVPSVYDGETLGKELAVLCKGEQHLLIPRASIGNPQLVQELKKNKDLLIRDLAIYDTFYEMPRFFDLKQMIKDREFDYAVFTSASTVKGFAEAAKGADFSLVCAVCIGRQTERAAAEYGMRTHTAKEASLSALVEAVKEINNKGKGEEQ